MARVRAGVGVGVGVRVRVSVKVRVRVRVGARVRVRVSLTNGERLRPVALVLGRLDLLQGAARHSPGVIRDGWIYVCTSNAESALSTKHCFYYV